MSELIYQLGIDWKLLLAQGLNFFILLTVLTIFVYKPLLKLLEDRRKKIEFGLLGAKEAERRLNEIEELKSEKMAVADREAIQIIGGAEKSAKKKFEEIVKSAEVKAETVLKDAALLAENKKQEELEKLKGEANLIIKEALIKTVELDPKNIDEKLISRATEMIKKKTA